MANDKIIRLLQQVDQSLSNATTEDSGLSAEIKLLQSQAQHLLANPDSIPEPDEFLLQTMSELLESFEVRHPVLTEWISKLSDQFSKMGI